MNIDKRYLALVTNHLMTMKRLFIFFIICQFLLSCTKDKVGESNSLDVNILADIYVKNIFRFYPEWGTFYSIENADHSSLSDNSINGLEVEKAAEDSLYALVQAVEQEKLSRKDLITYSILKESLESSIDTRVCKGHLWSINQMDAFYLWFRYIGNTQPVGDSISRKATLSRWKKIPQFIQNDMENNRIGIEKGYALPKVIVQQVIDQLNQLIAGSLETNVFYLPAVRDTSIAFQNNLKAIVGNEIMPVIKNYQDFLQNEYLNKAREKLSITSIPNGSNCYTAYLRNHTTLSASPEEVFQWGEQAIALREQTIVEIGIEAYGKTEINAIKAAFKSDSSNYFSTKEEILELAQSAILRAKNKLSDYFNILPQSDVILEPIPKIEEKTGSSEYLPASDDGSRPAKYVQQTYMPKTQTKGSVESTAFHETYPGHHLQIAISRELIESHPITKYVGNSGFSEGWARYTESLADEMGLYSSDKNRLVMYMGLPTGMVVDPGIHFKNWTREEAIEYTLHKQTSMTRSDAERYVDKISVMPGQMTTYGVGEMYFINLRKSANEKLGENFDLKAFHDECLKNGTVTLNFVSEQINKWIESQEE